MHCNDLKLFPKQIVGRLQNFDVWCVFSFLKRQHIRELTGLFLVSIDNEGQQSVNMTVTGCLSQINYAPQSKPFFSIYKI